MNRRNFFSALGTLAAGFSILPSAATYVRAWKPVNALWIPNPEWVSARYEWKFVCYDAAGTWNTWFGPPSFVPAFDRGANLYSLDGKVGIWQCTGEIEPVVFKQKAGESGSITDRHLALLHS